MVRTSLLALSLLAAGGQPAPFPKPRPPEPVPSFDKAAAYWEATGKFVMLWGGPPDPKQWDVVKQDIAAIPEGARWWMMRHGRPIVLLKGLHPEQWPGLDSPSMAAAKPSGLAPNHGPAVVDLDRSYPITPNGVAIGGSSVLLHELGHVMDRLLATDPNGGYPTFLSHQSRWLACHAKARWPHAKWHETAPSEAFAESFSLWCMTRKGGFERRLPPFVDPLVLEYWDETARMYGWR